MYANPSGSFTVGNSQRDPSDCTRDELLNLLYEEKARIKQQTYSISVLEAACAKERELRLQQSAVANEIDTLRAELSRTKLELEEERTRTAQLSRTVDTIQQSHQAQFRIDNTSFYTEQIAHLTHEIQDMTRQLKDERARSAQHMRTVSELEFTLNQERESNAQINDSARMEIASLTFQVDELSRELSDERDRVAQNTRAISMLENALANERTEKKGQLSAATQEVNHIQTELHRTLQLLESERSRCAQHVSTIQELENKQKHKIETGNSQEIQRISHLLDDERNHNATLKQSLQKLEDEYKNRCEEFNTQRVGLEAQVTKLTGEVHSLKLSNPFDQRILALESQLSHERSQNRTLEAEKTHLAAELTSVQQHYTDARTKAGEAQKQLSDLQNEYTLRQQEHSFSERRIQDLTTRLDEVTKRSTELDHLLKQERQSREAEKERQQHKQDVHSNEMKQLQADTERSKAKVSELEAQLNEARIALVSEKSKISSSIDTQKEMAAIGQQAQESLRALSEERSHVSALERKISELERDKIRLNAEAEEATNRLKRKTTECEEIEVRVRERDAALVGERDRVQELTRQIRSLEDAATAMRSDVERTQSELRQSREANSSVATEVTRLQSTLETERKRIVTLNTRITELESELRTESERRQLLDRSNKDVDGVRTKLENDLHDVQRALAEERRLTGVLRQKISDLKLQLRCEQDMYKYEVERSKSLSNNDNGDIRQELRTLTQQHQSELRQHRKLLESKLVKEQEQHEQMNTLIQELRAAKDRNEQDLDLLKCHIGEFKPTEVRELLSRQEVERLTEILNRERVHTKERAASASQLEWELLSKQHAWTKDREYLMNEVSDLRAQIEIIRSPRSAGFPSAPSSPSSVYPMPSTPSLFCAHCDTKTVSI